MCDNPVPNGKLVGDYISSMKLAIWQLHLYTLSLPVGRLLDPPGVLLRPPPPPPPAPLTLPRLSTTFAPPPPLEVGTLGFLAPPPEGRDTAFDDGWCSSERLGRTPLEGRLKTNRMEVYLFRADTNQISHACYKLYDDQPVLTNRVTPVRWGYPQAIHATPWVQPITSHMQHYQVIGISRPCNPVQSLHNYTPHRGYTSVVQQKYFPPICRY